MVLATLIDPVGQTALEQADIVAIAHHPKAPIQALLGRLDIPCQSRSCLAMFLAGIDDSPFALSRGKGYAVSVSPKKS